MARLARREVVLPATVAVLGELGPVAVFNRADGEYYGLPSTGAAEGTRWRAGRVLCSTADGREGFILRPMLRAHGPIRAGALACRALDLHQRFVHSDAERASALYNCIVPRFGPPRYAGDLAVLHYFAEKEGEGEKGEVIEYVHWFEEPGHAPAYPPMFSVGNGQFYIPRGPWKVGERGIEFTDDR